ncbi:hypothetical protein [Capnocytophaga felis]|uniref:Uncharacterized protein n=1 Tax=Capnocytophaga felis TaxID=2267611 RepID=A0A5M4BAH3_9FLAO|nr:hypothetical protein [Capnocytophaga felis]GET46302.1 hypothetical protein RCZ01_16040 [Capnocytophaga felis]GET48132.1 hypothetical protein RCZ02_09630 [Capnocytophaga felis]
MENFTQTEIRERILKVFNSCRSKKNTPFEESHFMDFLMFPPCKKNQIRNSFRGADKHGIFMRKIELEFGICFTLSDYDSTFSLDDFTQKVLERIGKTKSNKNIIKQRMNEKNYFIFEIVTLLILGTLYYFFGIHWLPILLTPLLLTAVYWICSHRIKDILHNKKLGNIILKQK